MDHELLLQLHQQLFTVRNIAVLSASLPVNISERPLLPIGSEGCIVGPLSVLEESDAIVAGPDQSLPLSIAQGLLTPEALLAVFKGNLSNFNLQQQVRAQSERLFLYQEDIYGEQLPLACGIALANSVTGKEDVTLCFLKARAVFSGLFHESLSFAALHKLKIVFVIQNQIDSNYVALQDLSIRALGYPMARGAARGDDIFAVRSAVHSAVLRAREGDGPALIELELPQPATPAESKGDVVTRFAAKLDALGLLEKRIKVEETVAERQRAAFEAVYPLKASGIIQDEQYAST